MTKDQTKKKKKDFGIFYTPQEVVDFIFDILNIWKDKEDKETHRWQTRKPQSHFPSVIDPACGEGIFLKTAVTSGFTGYHPKEKTPYVFGVDIDGEVVKRWEEISILHDLFKGKKEKMLSHFHQQDGLLELPEKVFNYKTGGLKEFDTVVGNPPYGGIGIQEITPDLEKSLFNYQIWEAKFQKNQKNTPGNLSIFGATIPDEFKKQIKNFPIEILFIDRFIQLSKPGGWIAIIIPDGVLTNSNSHYVRGFISHKTKVEAIVSLPRNTFKEVGTSAKTSILFLRKLKKDEKTEENYPVFLASLEKIEKKYLEEIVKSYEKYYNSGENHMNTLNSVQTTKDQNKREVVMVRVDKTLREMMEEKPQSRWDVKYWHPKYEKIAKIKFPLQPLKQYLSTGSVISVDHARQSKQETLSNFKDENHRAFYYSVDGISPTGYDLNLERYISSNGYKRLMRGKLKNGDIAIAISGVGSLGKSFIKDDNNNENTCGDLYIIRVKRDLINPYYLHVLLKTRYGKLQIERNEKGVSGQTKLTAEMIESFLIPEINKDVQTDIDSSYKKVANLHNQGIKAKKTGGEKAPKECLENAEKTLKDLIKRTEEVIEGNREDVN